MNVHQKIIKAIENEMTELRLRLARPKLDIITELEIDGLFMELEEAYTKLDALETKLTVLAQKVRQDNA